MTGFYSYSNVIIITCTLYWSAICGQKTTHLHAIEHIESANNNIFRRDTSWTYFKSFFQRYRYIGQCIANDD